MGKKDSLRHRQCQQYLSDNPGLLLHQELVESFPGIIEIQRAIPEYQLGKKQGFVDIMLILATHYNGTYFIPVETSHSTVCCKQAKLV